MNSREFVFAALVFGGVLYQLSLKRVPAHASPLITLAAVYGVASLACLLAVILFDGLPDRQTVEASLGWAVLGISAGVLLIEGAYLFAFRMGHPVSTLMLSTVVCVAIVLLGIGYFTLGERLSAYQWAGVILCLVGIALVKVQSQQPANQSLPAEQSATADRGSS